MDAGSEIGRGLSDVASIKALGAGQRVTFRAKALRCWDVAGERMALVGDETALTRVELGEWRCEEGRSYEFRDLAVREYPGGWHSAYAGEGSEIMPLEEDVTVSRDEAYIERTFKILSGVQRKKARKAGRLPRWTHPAAGGRRSKEGPA